MTTFTTLIAEKNPRDLRAANPVAYDRKRKAERRAAWQARAQQHDVAKPVVRDVLIDKNLSSARAMEDSCLDPSMPLMSLSPLSMARAISGPHARAYFAKKWRRDGGTLGQFETLNPYISELRKGGAR